MTATTPTKERHVPLSARAGAAFAALAAASVAYALPAKAHTVAISAPRGQSEVRSFPYVLEWFR
jgi:hypothetical protein